MSDDSALAVFGTRPPGVPCEPRAAAYAVVLDERARVAVVRAGAHWFLPGGGSLAGESPEATVLREIREECGRSARLGARLGQARQYFRDATRWYEMHAVFFRAEFTSGATSVAEHELVWLNPGDAGGFFHACHAWAVDRAHNVRAHPPAEG